VNVLPLNFFSFSALFNGITSLVLIPFLMLRRQKAAEHISFLLFLFLVVEWSSFYFLWLIQPNVEIAGIFARTCMIGVLLMPPVFLHFICSLLRIEKHRILIAANYLLSAFFILTVYSPLYADGMRVVAGLPYWPAAGNIFSLTVLHFVIVYLYAHILMWRSIVASTGERKNQILLVFIGTLVGGVAGATNYLSWYAPIPPILNIFTSVYVATITYAITKHELMDIRVVITRAAAYGLVGGLLIASFIGLNSFALPQAAAMAANALLALFWALAAHRLRALIQTPLEEKWITDWYNSDKLINHIATRLIPVLAKEEAFKIIAEELKSAIKIKNIEIRSGQQDIDLKDITQTKTGLIIPLSSSEGLEGALILGQKTSEDSYNEKDLTIFRTIMVQAMAIFDRIRPYEKIKKDFEANQKKLYDTERLLARSERIASLANTIREYNHEIKTPLSIIRGEAALLVKEPRDPKYLEWFKDLVYEQVDRANDIVESTLRLSTPKERKEISLNLNDVMDGALKLFPLAGVHLEKELGALPAISGDPEDLQLVFINLFKNAVEAMPDGGTLRLKSYWLKTGEESFAVAEIADTGAGIPPENLDRIFEPFFSSHVTKGRGLGLSIVFRVIREHLGRIEVKSEVGQGSTFIVKIPVKA